MRRVRQVKAVAFLLLFFAAAPAAFATATDSETAAQTVVDTTVKELLAILGDDALSSEQRTDSLGEIVYRRFDLLTFSRIVIGRRWKTFSEKQKDQFICEFKPYISGYVGNHFDNYRPESVEILEAQDESRGDVTVTTRIVGGRFDQTLLNYRLRKAKRDWLVIDLSFEGVNWAANLRAQFAELLTQGGPESAIAALRSKNASNTPCEAGSHAALSSARVLPLPIHAVAVTEGLENQDQPRQ